jgi:hypothetical protein
MTDDRARLEAAEHELADLHREEQAVLATARIYLEDLDRCGHLVAGVIASQIERLEDRRAIMAMELGELARDVDDERGRCSGSIGDDD